MATKKPCPACGKIDKHRNANNVCHECLTLIKTASIIKEELEALKAEKLNFLEKNKLDAKAFLSSNHFSVNSDIDNLTESVNEALRDLTAPFIASEKFLYDHYTDKYTEFVPCTQKAVRSMARMRKAIIKEIDAAYYRGIEKGQMLLTQLASGEMTVDQMSDAALKKESKRP